MGVSITVCTTCKFAPDTAVDTEGQSGGQRLAAALEDGVAACPDIATIVRHECLWACTQPCAVLIQSPGRTGYLAGRFAPNAASARALLDWADAYGQSEDGAVRYRLWPEGMKGHFIARIPQADTEGTP